MVQQPLEPLDGGKRRGRGWNEGPDGRWTIQRLQTIRLGAFLAGAILAETNFRTQIEADIRPFRGLLLGLFFLTTGTSIDMQVLLREWPNVLALLAGLIAIKTLIITAIGPRVGLALQESVRIGLLLSQGGEFGFVVFSLANRLGVLPLELNKLLIIVVVLSMALTPFLNEAGRRASSLIDDKSDAENKASETVNFDASEPVVILGFGQMGQVLANFLGNPLASRGDGGAIGWPYVAFDLDPTVVKEARKIGFPILYGDGSRPDVLQSAGINSPKAIMVMYTGKKKTLEAVQRLRLTFPSIPIYARAQDLKHLLDLKKSGATDAILANAETSLQLGSKLMKGLGVMSDDVAFLSQLIRDSMELQAQEAVSQSKYRELDIMKPLQLGAFLAGAILAETNFRTQIEADIRPFRGLLLGLFFLTTGTSIDMQVLLREWPNVLALLAGLIAIKTLIITAIGPRVGLTLQESVRIGLLLSQGGEFGFVVFSLANRLGVLPLELNKLLIIVVVLSMALTPFLNEAGRRASSLIDDKSDAENKASETVNFDASEPIVILGFGQMGQVLANFLGNPLASRGDGGAIGWPYVAFDLDPTVVKEARKIGFPILYGDGSRPYVLQSAGINSPKAIMVMYTGKKKTLEAVQRLRLTFPSIPIYARAQDLKHLLDLKKSGATVAILANAETSLQLGSKLMKGLGVMSDDVAFLSQLIRDSMELQAQEAVSQSEYRELDIMKPLQVKVSDLMEARVPVATTSPEYELSELKQKDRASLSRIQKEVDAEEQDYELNQAVNLEGNGVLCSKQGTEESSIVGSQDALGQKNLVDPSIPSHTSMEEP